jgi:arsenate reductase-like glutaredoxin family protein
MGCKKAQGFLETNEIAAAAQVIDARKVRYGRAEALKLAKSAHKVVASKGKKVVIFDMQNDLPDDATLIAHLLGPSGNLKAPTLRIGDTLLVGYGEEAYKQVLARGKV